SLHRGRVRYRALDDLDPVAHVLQVGCLAGAEIVQHPHLMALGEEPVDKMGADKTGAARDQVVAHDSPPFLFAATGLYYSRLARRDKTPLSALLRTWPARSSGVMATAHV